MIGSGTVGHVTAAERAGVTGLLTRSTNGSLPLGTRLIEFNLTNRVVTGLNDASADNLSFVLSPAEIRITSHGFTGSEWRVEFTSRLDRHYVLERSPDLALWLEVTAPMAGTGTTTVLFDTNPPAEQAFYRISSRPP